MVRALGKTWILNKVFNRDTDALKVELGNDENGPLLTEDNPGSVVLRGNDGSIQNGQPGLKHKANYSGSATATHTVTGNAVTITNDGASDLTVTINDIVTTVLAGETINKSVLCYDSFTSIIVTTTVAYRLFVYEGI